jgi:hypothetical protein
VLEKLVKMASVDCSTVKIKRVGLVQSEPHHHLPPYSMLTNFQTRIDFGMFEKIWFKPWNKEMAEYPIHEE